METKMDVAVLGLGGMGGTHVGAAKASPYIEKIHGYEPDPERAALRGKELGVEATANLDEILNNPEIKLVYIASINEVHSEQAVKALKAGKAVLCEKPMGISLEEAQDMIKAERQTGNFLQIGFELHYSKMYQTVKKWVDDGLIGNVLNSQCRYFCSEFHLKNSWRSNSKGTLVGEKLSHYLDLIRWWTKDDMEEVYSLNSPNFVTYFNHPDNHQISLRFKKGAIGILNFIMGIAESDHRDPLLEMLEKQSEDGHFLQYYICGSKGAIEADVFKRRLRRWEFTDGPKQIISKIVDKVTFPKEEDLIWFHNTHGQNVKVAELVAKGMKPEVEAYDAYESMKLCFAVEKSERERRIVKFSEYDF
jgi:predicted dehydrogenase